MKKNILIFCILAMGKIAFSQTNTFPSSGNVGIGTTSPGSIVEIESGSSTPILTINSIVTPNGAIEGGRLDLQLKGGSSKFGLNGDIPGSIWMIGQANDASYGAANIRSVITTGGNTGRSAHVADLAFSTKPSGNEGISEAFRIKGNGNAGIGTTNPVSKFVISDAGANGFEINPVNGFNNGTDLLAYNRNTSAYKTLNLISSDFRFTTGSVGQVLLVTSSGDVYIGNSTPSPGYKLAVGGNIRAKEIKVETGWADFVFKPDYKLRSLKETEQFINQNGHLPEIPSAKEVEENGINLGEMNAKLLQKIEELTLHLINQDKMLQRQQIEIDVLRSKL